MTKTSITIERYESTLSSGLSFTQIIFSGHESQLYESKWRIYKSPILDELNKRETHNKNEIERIAKLNQSRPWWKKLFDIDNVQPDLRYTNNFINKEEYYYIQRFAKSNGFYLSNKQINDKTTILIYIKEN